MARSKSFSIPGLSFSWKRALGITQTKQKIARKTGIPTTKAGIVVVSIISWLSVLYVLNDRKVAIWILYGNEMAKI